MSELRDEITELLTEHEWRAVSIWEGGVCACGWDTQGELSHREHQVDVVHAFVQRHIDAAREQVAEQIAQAIEKAIAQRLQHADVAYIDSVGIARQHAKDQS